MPEVDSIIIWDHGKDIYVEKENSLFDKIAIEAFRIIYEVDLLCGGPNNVDYNRQNEKCLEIIFKEPFLKFEGSPHGTLRISAALFPFEEGYTSTSVMLYTENTQSWVLWMGERSKGELIKMTDEYLAASH